MHNLVDPNSKASSGSALFLGIVGALVVHDSNLVGTMYIFVFVVLGLHRSPRKPITCVGLTEYGAVGHREKCFSGGVGVRGRVVW